MYQYKLAKLNTGLRLIIAPMPQVESLTVMVGVGAGSRYETRRINGLFHFLEHMAFKGTKKRPSTLAIATEVANVGGIFNAFTDKEFTGYYLKLASKHARLAFDILADMLTNSLFKTEEIEREKGVIIEEINMYEDTPMRRVWKDFERLFYGDNSMGWSIAGEKKNIKGINRSDFLRVINQLYYPANMILAVAGKVTPTSAGKMARQYFGSLRAAGLQKTGRKVTKQIKISQEQSRLKLIYKKTEQAHFCLGVAGYQYSHPDRFALGVLSVILGGGMSSRLWIQIRERRGLAYYVGSLPEFFTDSGYLLARAGVKLAKIEEAIKVTLAEFNNLATKPVSLKELKKAKESLKGGLILALEDSQLVASRYASQFLLEKKIRTPKESAALIDEVTPADIKRVAKDIFKSEKLNLAIIGPYKSEVCFKKLLRV